MKARLLAALAAMIIAACTFTASAIDAKIYKIIPPDSCLGWKKVPFVDPEYKHICPGDSVLITASGPFVSYNWSPMDGLRIINDSTVMASPAATTVYTVTGINSRGCERQKRLKITVDQVPAITANLTAASCFGGSNGAIDLRIASSATTYYVNWSNGATTEDISGLSAGTYSVTVTDSGKCSSTASYIITQPDSLQAAVASTNKTCDGSTGTANVSVSGGVSPYSYGWSNGATTDTISGLTAGDYTVTVTDANLCSISKTTTVTEENNCTHLSSASCGLSGIALNKVLYCQAVTNATDYEYKVTDLTTSISYYRTRGSNATSFLMLYVPQVTYGRSYQVEVRAKVNGEWGAFGEACTVSTMAFPIVKLLNTSCGVTVSALTQVLTGEKVIGASRYEYEIKNLDSVAETITYIRYSSSNAFTLSAIQKIRYSRNYSVRVRAFVGVQWGEFGAGCTVTTPAIPATSISAAYCGDTIAAITQTISIVNVPLAWNYEYQVTDLESDMTTIYLRNSAANSFKLSSLETTTYGKTYSIRVRAYQAGAWGPLGAACNITVGPVPMTNLTEAYCNTTLTSLSQPVYINSVAGADDYRYRITDVSDPSVVFIKNRGSSATTFAMSSVSGVVANKTYFVEVSSNVNGVWSDYGAVCTLSTPAPSSRISQERSEPTASSIESGNPGAESAAGLQKQLKLTIFPNPSNGQQIVYRAEGSVSEYVTITVTDVFARTLRSLTSQADGSITFEKPLPPGVYYVSLVDGEVIKTEKLVVR